MLKATVKRQPWSWQAPAAFACFAMAVVAGISGSALTTGWILNSQQHPSLYIVGLTLLMVTLPILILGGHCLDLLDRKRQLREANKSRTRAVAPTI